MTEVNVEYSKNDFLYYKHGFDSNGNQLYDCMNNIIIDEKLNNDCSGSTDQSDICSTRFRTNVCNNKKYADILLSKKINHSGSDELYKNITSQYNMERLSCVNLGIGIIIGGICIAKLNLM